MEAVVSLEIVELSSRDLLAYVVPVHCDEIAGVERSGIDRR
jgi:hypothetical protein